MLTNQVRLHFNKLKILRHWYIRSLLALCQRRNNSSVAKTHWQRNYTLLLTHKFGKFECKLRLTPRQIIKYLSQIIHWSTVCSAIHRPSWDLQDCRLVNKERASKAFWNPDVVCLVFVNVYTIVMTCKMIAFPWIDLDVSSRGIIAL